MGSKIILVVTAILFLSGCVANKPKVNTNDPNQVSQNVRTEYDKFQKTTSFVGIDLADSTTAIDDVRLRAWKTEDPTTYLYQIYIEDKYDGAWRFYDEAYDSNGKELSVVRIDRRTRYCSGDRCARAEKVGIIVSRTYLEANSRSGISIKLVGKRGEEIFFLPGGYIEGFLRAVN